MAVNPFRYQASLRPLDNRHCTAGCMLALVLLVPLVSRTWSPFVVLSACVLYVTLVVPYVAGYFTPIAFFRWLRRVADSSWLGYWFQDLVFQLWIFFGFLHFFYRELETLHSTATQILFCVLSERVFCPTERMCSLIFLSFYNIVAYIIKALTERRWSRLRLTGEGASNVFRQAATYMVARMNKGVASLSVLLTISYQAHRLEPSLSFLAISLGCYLLTHVQTSHNFLLELCQNYEFQLLEGLEEWYIPLVLRLGSMFVSGFLLVLLYTYQPVNLFNLFLTGLVLYNNIFVALYRLQLTCWEPLKQQKALTDLFLPATEEQLKEKGDSCPVCLESMKRARVTPCKHVFHAACLRKWVHQSYKCPMCMQSLYVP